MAENKSDLAAVDESERTIQNYRNEVKRLNGDLAALNAENERLKADDESHRRGVLNWHARMQDDARTIKEQSTEIASLRERLAAAQRELERDRCRLDWLERDYFNRSAVQPPRVGTRFSPGWNVDLVGETLRAAIDYKLIPRISQSEKREERLQSLGYEPVTEEQRTQHILVNLGVAVKGKRDEAE